MPRVLQKHTEAQLGWIAFGRGQGRIALRIPAREAEFEVGDFGEAIVGGYIHCRIVQWHMVGVNWRGNFGMNGGGGHFRLRAALTTGALLEVDCWCGIAFQRLHHLGGDWPADQAEFFQRQRAVKYHALDKNMVERRTHDPVKAAT